MNKMTHLQNNNEFDYDSDDSSTTSASSNSVNNDNNINIDKEKSLKNELIKPIQSKSFNNNNKNIIINDAFELSLLRFMHLIFSFDGLINFDNLNKWMDLNNPLCIELNDFFIDNPGFMFDSDFYYSETGQQYREKWFELLSNRQFFNYKNNFNTEIYPSIENFYKFLENFFPKLIFMNQGVNLMNEQEKLENIYNSLNFNFESFKILYGTYNKLENNMIHFSSIQNILINNINIFVWEIVSVKELINNNLSEIYSESEFRYY